MFAVENFNLLPPQLLGKFSASMCKARAPPQFGSANRCKRWGGIAFYKNGTEAIPTLYGKNLRAYKGTRLVKTTSEPKGQLKLEVEVDSLS